MSEIKNPLNETTRSKLYIVGIIVAAVVTPVTITLGILGLEAWIPLATALASAVGIAVGALAKAFLQPSLAETLQSLQPEPEEEVVYVQQSPAEREKELKDLFEAARKEAAEKKAAEAVNDM